MSGEQPERHLSRLDPDLAAASTRERSAAPAAAPVRRWPSRRYQLLAGMLAFAVLVGLALLTLGGHRTATVGIPAGARLPVFAAPLAGTSLVGDANLRPPCTEVSHDRRALNICLLLARGPLVLAFFAPQNSRCARVVDTLQALAPRFAARGVQMAAVAVASGPKAAAASRRSHRWTIPVAYDRDGAVAAAYGAVVCPLIELSRRGGVVFERLVGNGWDRPARLATQLARLAAQ